jgi:hypothetical protein
LRQKIWQDARQSRSEFQGFVKISIIISIAIHAHPDKCPVRATL